MLCNESFVRHNPSPPKKTQSTVVQLAQLQNTNLDQRDRVRFVAGIDELRRAAWRKGGSYGAIDDDAKVCVYGGCLWVWGGCLWMCE